MKYLIIIAAMLSLSACSHFYYNNSNYKSKANLKREFSTINSNLHVANSSFWDFAIIAGHDFNQNDNSLMYIMFCPWADRSKLKKEYLNIDDVYLMRNVVLNQDNFEQFKDAVDFILDDMSASIEKKNGNFYNYEFFIKLEPNKNSDGPTSISEIVIKYGKTEQGYSCKLILNYWGDILPKPYSYSLNTSNLLNLKSDFLSAEKHLNYFK